MIISDTGAARTAFLIMDDVSEWYIAWGIGDGAWTSAPEPDQTATTLVGHLGHFKATAQFVVPDVAGVLISANGDKWTVSGSPTRFIFVSSDYDYTDEDTAVIREIAIYTDATPAGGHESDNYLPVANLSVLGQLWTIENIAPLTRAVSKHGSISTVFQIGPDDL